GAKREVVPTASATGSTTAPTASSTATTQPEPPQRGRVDAPTIIVGSIAAVGLALGTGAGIYALSTRPSDSFITGRDGSYETLTQKTDNAHTAALVADIGFGVGIVAALVTAYLYFGRLKDPNPSTPPTTGHAVARGRAAAGEAARANENARGRATAG